MPCRLAPPGKPTLVMKNVTGGFAGRGAGGGGTAPGACAAKARYDPAKRHSAPAATPRANCAICSPPLLVQPILRACGARFVHAFDARDVAVGRIVAGI